MVRPTQSARTLSAAAIKQAARRQMEAHGTAGVSLRGIARELGVTAPAIYNYFPRLDDLQTALLVDSFTAFAEAMEAAAARAAGARIGAQMEAILLTYRQWALDHRLDFLLMFGNPIPGYIAPAAITVPLARRPFMALFHLFIEAHARGELAIPPEYAGIPPAVAEHIAAWQAASGIDMPAALLCLLMTGWGRCHGLIMLEMFEHIQPLVGDAGAFYRYEIRALLRQVGLGPPAP